MKTIISAVVVALIMMSTANAQQDSTKHKMQKHALMAMQAKDDEGFKYGGPEKFGGKKGESNGQRRGFEHGKGQFAHLKLTDEQRRQGKIIRENTGKQIANLYNNDKLTLGDYKKNKATLIQDQKTKLDGLLTPEQKITIADSKKKIADNMQVHAAARLERMKIDLGLKDEQVASIKASQAQMRDKAKAIHEDAALLPEQKREQMKALMNQQKESLKTVLTAEQLVKIESRKPIREGRR